MKEEQIEEPNNEDGGIFAIWGHPEASRITCLGLQALQHRGQESSGICASDSHHLVCSRSKGLAAETFNVRLLQELVGTVAIGITSRFPPENQSPLDPQPFTASSKKGQFAMAYNGNFMNISSIRFVPFSSQAKSKSAVLLNMVASSREPSLAAAFRKAVLSVRGAYSLVMLTPCEMVVARDPKGLRPLAMGSLSYDGRECHLFASETCAFDQIGAQYEGDVEPGEMVIISSNGIARERFTPESPPSYCAFEHVSRSRRDSIVFGRSVQESREMLGRLLAREHPANADLVVPVHESGIAAAIGYASESRIPYREALARSCDVGLPLIGRPQFVLNFGNNLQIHPVRFLIEGKRVVLVGDSIVRAPSMQKIVRMVRQAGACEVHLRVSCSPTIAPCYYGVDIPARRELIAATRSVEEIQRFLEADSLCYLSLEGVRKAIGDTDDRFCLACYTTSYPTTLFVHAEADQAQEPMAEPENVALTFVENQIRLVSFTQDGEYQFLDEARNLHNILYVISSETKALQAAVEELEDLLNYPKVAERDLQDFFERNPDFVKNDEYKEAHAHIVLTRDNENALKPDFVLEPINQTRFCDLLELKHPLAQIFVMKARRTRFSAMVFEAAAQLREYSMYFEDPKNRETIKRNYGLSAYKPRLFVIIGRRGSVSPIELRNMELDAPQLHLRTYDDVLERMKAKITAMQDGSWRKV